MSDIVERLRALEAWIRQPTGEPYNMNNDLFDDAADEITRLRAENSSLSAWQCFYTDGKTGLVGDEHGNQYCSMATKVEQLLSVLADTRTDNMRLREWNAEIALNGRELVAENERLRAALRDARVSVEGWADYASDYIKEKWDLKGDLARIDAALEGK